MSQRRIMELTLEQAADYLGISTDDLMRSRMRGLPPGKLGHTHNDGKVYFNEDDLLPPPTANIDLNIYQDAEIAEDAPYAFDGYVDADSETEAPDPHSVGGVDNWGYDWGEEE